MKVYLDGQFIDDTEAAISIFDASVQHAVGLFETMLAIKGRVFCLESHIDRLITSAKLTGLTDKLRMDPLCEAVELTLHENSLTDARLRLTLTGGNLAGIPRLSGTSQPSIFIQASAPTAYPDTFFTQGVSVIIADPKANPFDLLAGHKSTHYWSRLRTLSQAATVGAGEALWFSVTNHLCGGAVSNAIIVRDGQLLTPIARGEEAGGALPSAVLPGTTRQVLLDIAEQQGIAVKKQMLSIKDVLEADELLLCNTSWGVLPVVQVEKKIIAQGVPGPITMQLREALLRRMNGQIASTN